MVKWGLIGCGDISDKRVAPGIKSQPESLLAAVVSPYAGQLDGFLKKHEIRYGYLDTDQMLENADIDAVYVATPVYLHYEAALKALKAGKHVLVEKPMAMDDEQCRTLICEAERSSKKLGVAYFRRFFPKLADVKRLIGDGTIGKVIQARILYHSWYDPAGTDPKGWRVKKDLAGGGPLWDIGCHKIDMLIDLLGMPRSVSALMDTYTHKYEVEDSCSIMMEMECEAHCLASFNWNSRVWSDEFEILGTCGKIIMDPCDSDRLTVRMNPRVLGGMGREETTVSRPCHHNVHYPLIDDFVKAVLEGREPMIPGIEAYKTNRILNAAEISAASGKKIIL